MTIGISTFKLARFQFWAIENIIQNLIMHFLGHLAVFGYIYMLPQNQDIWISWFCSSLWMLSCTVSYVAVLCLVMKESHCFVIITFCFVVLVLPETWNQYNAAEELARVFIPPPFMPPVLLCFPNPLSKELDHAYRSRENCWQVSWVYP